MARLSLLLLGFAVFGSLPAAETTGPDGRAQPGAAVGPLSYHGWTGALRMRNEQAEVIVVPEIGRVMSFRFHDGQNVLWEDVSLRGKRGDPAGREWINFGGDKTWPAPEAEWKTHTKREKWMPPPGFDGMPGRARRDGSAIVLTSLVDPFYGIRTSRRITLRGDDPVMEIETEYEKVSGAALPVGIWVITQFRDPMAVYVPAPETSRFEGGYFRFRDTPWPQLTTMQGLIKVTRDPAASHKLGSDADRMLWVGAKEMCLVATTRVAGAEYPDRGASAEVYTNPDPKTYVELETLGPLATLAPGQRIRQTNTYTLLRRREADADADARRILGRQ
ncbi:MAG: DUF4380 domain-containing protein [Opitutaceae bacterium]|nr:DUF4380 domain-containing protein [Opitutaceae bacterium]